MSDLNTNLDETDSAMAVMATPQSLAVGIARAEIDQQITTARAYPRSLKQVTDRIFSLATLDKESAEESMYALPRGGKPITGPSIRFAEVVKQAYGNCRAAARVVHVDRDEKYVEAEGVFHDLETNVATTARVRRRIVDSKGRLYSDDMIIVTGNAAASIALRNAIMGGVPKPLWRRAYEAVQMTIAGDITTLVENRQKAIAAFAVYGVKPEQIYTALGVQGLEDVVVEHIPVLRGMFATLKNAEATVEEMFGSTTAPGTAPQTLHGGFSDKGGTKAADKPKPPAQAAQAADIPHDPKTGEVTEPTQPVADEVHFLDNVFGDKNGRRVTFKNGMLFSSVKWEGPATPMKHRSYALTEPQLADVFGLGKPEEPETEVEAEAEPEVEQEEPHVDAEEQDPEPEPEEEAAQEAPAATEEEGDPEFNAYIKAIEAGAADWVEVKAAMKTFYSSDYFKGLTLEQQNQIRGDTWGACVERSLPGLPDQAADMSAFRLWIEWIDGDEAADAIRGTLRALEQDPEFAAKDDTLKATVRKAAAERMTALGA